MTIMPALTAAEREDLAQQVDVINAAEKSYTAVVGEALKIIRDRRLYLQSHNTFEAFVLEHWSFSRQRAHQLIQAADVAANLSGCQQVVDIGTLPESHARELVGLSADEQRSVFAEAVETAPANGMTATHIAEVRDHMLRRDDAVAEHDELDDDANEDEDDEPADATGTSTIARRKTRPISCVRQLHSVLRIAMSEEEHVAFDRQLRKMKTLLGTTNVIDTLIAVMRRAEVEWTPKRRADRVATATNDVTHV